jgi:ABC-type amino acid transport substrate-binding protein
MSTDYFGISFRNPESGKLEGFDVEMANALADSLKARLDIVETSFSVFVADLLADKCDIGMFGIAATLSRAQAVEFSAPYMVTGMYAVARKDNPHVKTWADLDQPGITIAVRLGSVGEPLMRRYFKQANVVAVQPPASPEQEVATRRADALGIDYAIATQITANNDWATILTPDQPLVQVPYSYAVAPGDQVWLNYVNLFLASVRRDGRLATFADKYRLGPILNVDPK